MGEVVIIGMSHVEALRAAAQQDRSCAAAQQDRSCAAAQQDGSCAAAQQDRPRAAARAGDPQAAPPMTPRAAEPAPSWRVINLRERPDLYDKPRLDLPPEVLDPAEAVVLVFDGNWHAKVTLQSDFGGYRLGTTTGAIPPASQSALPLISHGLMDAVLDHGLGPSLNMVARAHAQLAGRRVIQVCTPPPIRRLPTPEEARAEGREIREVLRYLDFDSTPDVVRREVHARQSARYAAQARSFGVPFLTPPSEALTADGFLAPGYWDDDPTHANAAYGRLVLAQIRATLAA